MQIQRVETGQLFLYMFFYNRSAISSSFESRISTKVASSCSSTVLSTQEHVHEFIVGPHSNSMDKSSRYVSAKTNESNKQFTDIKVDNYLYHSVGEFNLSVLMSILEVGIVSRNNRYLTINSNGLGENGNDYISLSKSWVLQTESYAAIDLSVIVNPHNLKMYARSSRNFPQHEVQIKCQVPVENIVGIHIPDNYLLNEISGLKVFRFETIESLRIQFFNMSNWLEKEFGLSIFSDKTICTLYEEVEVALKNITSIKINDTGNRLNEKLIEFITSLYSNKIGKDNITVVDIIEFHTKGKIPLYNSDGKLISSSAIYIPNPKFEKNSCNDGSHEKVIDRIMMITELPEKYREWLIVYDNPFVVNVEFPPNFSSRNLSQMVDKLNTLGLTCEIYDFPFNPRQSIRFKMRIEQLLDRLFANDTENKRQSPNRV